MTARLLCLLLLSTMQVCATAAPAAPPTGAAGEKLTAKARPSLVVDTLDHGRFDLAGQRGQWVVVNFWATWCAPCIKEMPELSEFDAERDDVRVIGLAFEEIEPADMRKFLTRRPVVYPIALLDVYAPPADFEVPRGLPMTWVIDPEGAVARRFLGPVTAADLSEVIDAGDR